MIAFRELTRGDGGHFKAIIDPNNAAASSKSTDGKINSLIYQTTSLARIWKE